jgi:leucyl-tRNA synthetase
MGPLIAAKPWSTTGLEGARKFLDRVYRLVTDPVYTDKMVTEYDKELEKSYNKTVKKVTSDYEALSFNTAIAQMMVFVNDCYKAEHIYKGFVEGLVLMLSPITPHICEEMWEILGHNNTLAYEAWPKYDESLTQENNVTYAVMVNGKIRATLDLPLDISKGDAIKEAKSLDKIKAFIDGHDIVKEIFVPKKIVNIVIK